MTSGKLYTDSSVADLSWATTTVTIGFNLMGIWPPCTDGTDINALDVSRDQELVVTAGDNGKVQLFNYPCVADGAGVQSYSGHASFVTCVRFVSASNAEPEPVLLVSTGGEDMSVMLWCVDPTRGENVATKASSRRYETLL